MDNKRSKNSRQRGSKTHGWGAMKKHRGAGHRGGRGAAGSGKRGDAKKPSIWRLYFAPLFDTLSFDNMATLNIDISNYDSLDFLNGYTLLTAVTIDSLEKNMLGLVNDNITLLTVVNDNALVDTIVVDIANTGSFIFDSTLPIIVDITADNSDILIDNAGGTIILNVERVVKYNDLKDIGEGS